MGLSGEDRQGIEEAREDEWEGCLRYFNLYMDSVESDMRECPRDDKMGERRICVRPTLSLIMMTGSSSIRSNIQIKKYFNA